MEVLCKVQSAIFISLTNFTISPYMFLANRGHGHAVSPRSGGRRGWSVYCINMWVRRGACVVTDSLVTLRTEGEGGRMREDTEATPKLERAEGEGGGGEAGEGVCNGTFLDGFR